MIRSFVPDNMAGASWTGGNGQNRMYLIPMESTLNYFVINKYLINIRMTGTMGIPPDILNKPTGRIRIGLYRCIRPIIPLSASAIVMGELVGGSETDTGNILVNTTFNDISLTAPIIVLGGSYWIVMKLEDNTAGTTNKMAFTIDGITTPDALLTGAAFIYTQANGALPATLTANLMATSQIMPYAGGDLV